MATTIIGPGDLVPFADIKPVKAVAMIEDAMADASRVAPCILDDELEPKKVAQFKSVLRAAILRWNDSGSGAVQSQTAGPFGQSLDTRVQRRGMFWPSEIEALQEICKGDTNSSGAFDVDTVSTSWLGHNDTCSINFGGGCSCGAILTQGLPLYGG